MVESGVDWEISHTWHEIKAAYSEFVTADETSLPDALTSIYEKKA